MTVANTWAANDTVTLTINGKDLVLTIGTGGNATSAVATSIKEAWNSGTRLDGTGSFTTTSNFGGQEHGEFAEVTASVSGSVVTLTANKPGVPFTLSVTESTAGDGVATEATAQAATGKHFWSNADNWDSGTVPADDDIVVFKDSDVSVKYGLPNSTDLEVTIQQWQSFTGEIGLPAINKEGSIHYYEYRQRYVRLDDGGGGSDIAHRFGLGDTGRGSSLINIKHITVKCSPVVYNTGRPLDSRPGTKALNICCTSNTSTLHIVAGSVDFSSQDGSASAFVAVTQTGGDSRCMGGGIHTTDAQLTVAGGTSTVGQSGAIATVYCSGGTLTLENQTGTITTAIIEGTGTVNYNSTATITGLSITGGLFDARNSTGGFSLGTTTVYKGGRFIDPYRRRTIATAFRVYYEPNPDLILGASPAFYISIS